MKNRLFAFQAYAVMTLWLAPLAHGVESYIKPNPDTDDYFYPVQIDSAKIAKTCSAYVPAYSHIYMSKKERVALAITLSIRNVDSANRILIGAIDYFDTKGKRVEKLIDTMFALAPMATASFVIEQRDDRGGAGASFIVEWAAETDVASPIIESIMAGYVGTRGLSFSSRAVDLSNCAAGG